MQLGRHGWLEFRNLAAAQRPGLLQFYDIQDGDQIQSA